MPKEYEFRFTEYVKSDIIKKILKMEGTQIHKAIIYEYITFMHPLNEKNTYIRVRKEFDKITFTYKKNTDKKFADEYEVNISEYDTFIKILYMLGFKKAYSIQKLREKWITKGCTEIVFDTYPALPEIMEVECETLDDLNKMMKKLDLKEEKYYNMYRKLYGIDQKKKKKLADLTFETVNDLFIKKIRYNKDLFNKIVEKQQQYIKKINHINIKK